MSARPSAPPPSRRKMPDWTSLKALCAKALANGGTRTAVTIVEWDISRKCERPVWVHLWARSDLEDFPEIWDTEWCNAAQPRPAWARKSDVRMNLEMQVPCRKCAPCLRDRGREWAKRCWSEIRASNRTWFGTITVEPEKHFMFLTRARKRLSEKDVDLDGLPEIERFREVEREINRELQLMVKRLRKAGHQFRFIMVCESSPDHQSGLPHYHCLIHEVGAEIKHKYLAGRRADSKRGTEAVAPAWPHGFSSFKLVESQRKAAWYVCKYLNKDAKVRVRASKSYGREPSTVSTDKSFGETFSQKVSTIHSNSVNTKGPHKDTNDSPKRGAMGGLTQGRDENGQHLSGPRISDPAGEVVQRGNGLSKSAAEPHARKRQHPPMGGSASERQQEVDPEACPPF